MNIAKFAKRIEKTATDNSPLILTIVGVAGTVSTAILTGRATYRAAQIIYEEQEAQAIKLRGEGDFPQPMSGKEKFELTWKLYIPAVSMGVVTCGSIVMANRIGARRAAAVAAAYTISERAFEEYREKVVEKIGETKEKEVREEIARDRVNRRDDIPIVIAGDTTSVLCHDAFSNQFFYSDMETLRKAQNDINAQILHADYATVTDFYHYVNAEGLEETSVSGEMGWNTNKFLELHFSTVLHKEKTPCISFDFAVMPIRDPWRFC